MFLRRLIASGSGKLFLIGDNLLVHHSVKVSWGVEVHRDESELFFPPRDAPEDNPDESPNNPLNQQMSGMPHDCHV